MRLSEVSGRRLHLRDGRWAACAGWECAGATRAPVFPRHQIWARLLAASADPSRASRFRIAFIEAAKKMDPLDAPFLLKLHERSGRADGAGLNSMASEFNVTRDEIAVSWSNLRKLELLMEDSHSAVISPFGREFVRAISD
jgi:hypothetical protein